MKLDSVIPFGRSFDEYSLMFALTEQDWEFFHDVASTQTILRELSDLLDFLSGVPAVKADDGSNPVKDVGLYAEELQKICALSIQHGLPVIFHG